MWCFLLFAVILPIVPALTEVVESVSECNEFLLEEKPPEVPDILQDGNILNPDRYKPICQTYQNTRRFFTLYDVENRIPVFSAYKYKGVKDTKRPNITWMREPQLEDRNTNNMRDEKFLNQAYNPDYTNIEGYNRGHLFPVCHANSNDKESAFTFTNAVPQAITFNNGSWQNMETCIKCVLEKYCINNNNVPEGFVVTGAVPSMNKTLKNKVNIPSVLWSAFCCYSHKEQKWLASAHWGNNTAEPSAGIFMETNTLNKLHQELRIKVFNGKSCPLDETVVNYYKNLPRNCHCPPRPLTTSAPPTTTSTTAASPTTTSTTAASPTTTSTATASPTTTSTAAASPTTTSTATASPTTTSTAAASPTTTSTSTASPTTTSTTAASPTTISTTAASPTTTSTTAASPTTTSTATASPTTSTATTTQTTTNVMPKITGPQTYTTIHDDISLDYLSSGYLSCIRRCRNRYGTFNGIEKGKFAYTPKSLSQYLLLQGCLERCRDIWNRY